MNRSLLIWLTLFSPLALRCAETTNEGHVSSTNASYDGSALKLTGHVILDHGLGRMNAEEASLEKQDAGSDFPFSLIHLHKQVQLTLQNNARLSCDHADLDFLELKGALSAPISGLVVFEQQLTKKEHHGASLSLQSPKIDLALMKAEVKEHKLSYDVDTIIATDGVVIDYNKAFLLEAGRAVYSNIASANKDLQGTLKAYAKDDASVCTLLHDNDKVQARSIELDLIHSTLTMDKPEGTIQSSLLPQHLQGSIAFITDHMTWDHLQNRLTLKGKSFITESSLGTITTQEMLMIQQAIIKGKKVISKIETVGASELIYQDPCSSGYHKLYCQGTMKIDREHLHASLTSPIKDNKTTPYSDQVSYQEPELGAFADSLFVEFTVEEEKLQPVSLSLKGNVSLFSRNEQEPFRCSIADRMSYCPTTKTLILSANPGQKVLFWDEQQAVRMSAQEVHLTQNPITKQTVIQGVGKVKFSLSTEENETLKKVFPQYKPLPEGQL